MPHPHELRKKKVGRVRRFVNAFGHLCYDTHRACDNCDEPIVDNVYYECSEGCEVDFCVKCHDRLEALFVGLDRARADWVARFISSASVHVIGRLGAAARRALADELAFAWPLAMFERLLQAVVDVASAKVVHLQDMSEHIASDVEFWSTVGFLQLLYAANSLPARECRFGELLPRGPRVAPKHFVITAVDKCDAEGEYDRWDWLMRSSPPVPEDKSCQQSSPRVDQPQTSEEQPEPLASMQLQSEQAAPPRPPSRLRLAEPAAATPSTTGALSEVAELVLVSGSVDITARFATFLAHHNLLPVSFWARCLEQDLAKSFFAGMPRRRRIRQLNVEFQRDDAVAFVDGVVHAFGSPDMQSVLCRPLAVTFAGELGSGPGVTREFLQMAVRSILEIPANNSIGHGAAAQLPVWECDPELRTYWFRFAGDPQQADAFRALGTLLGHTMLSRNVLPVAFPPPLFELLLKGLGSSRARSRFSLSDLAMVCPAVARSLERLKEYDGEDVAELFTLDWPRADELHRGNRTAYVDAYVQWYFFERYAVQVNPMVEGFKCIVGSSKLLRTLVDASQLEQILCGSEAPVDIDAIRSGAVLEDWPAEDAEYLESLWEVLRGLTEAEKRCFVTFVSACSRTPPRGWQDLGLRVQKSGGEEQRLPSAFTCFTLLLLPRYSSTDLLRARLRTAIVNTEGFGLS